MKHLTILALCLTFSATIANASEPGGGGRRAPKAFQIKFASIGTGIDHDAYEKVKAYVADGTAEGKIAKFTEESWGREGERTLCIEFKGWEVAYENRAILDALLEGAKYTTHKVVLQCGPNTVIGSHH